MPKGAYEWIRKTIQFGNMKWTIVYKWCLVLFHFISLQNGNRHPNYRFPNNNTRVEKAIEFCGGKKKIHVGYFTSKESLFVLEAHACLFLFSTWCFSGGLSGHSRLLWRHLHCRALHICQGEAAPRVSDTLCWPHPYEGQQSSTSVTAPASRTRTAFSCLRNGTALTVSVSPTITTLSKGGTTGLGNKWTINK